MKKGIHPNYQKIAFHDIAVDKYFIVGSTLKTAKTIEIEGIIYPYVALDISSQSHPFYTGKQKMLQSDGRVALFNRRFSGSNSKKEV
ncbi:50S ribosomal protein L31 [Psychromonas sp. CNPT3]|uniref:type B 50S ribosomal protein L31 n=1 Tax=Psychromonas sp. CNPT3 TaxID=314282 RepID=UPI00006E895B|nr:type B 50S ribosomal protein L31 [Psychromonas sp. CNPT3]AGH80487.1 50S ribosomal protein L31 [Psychromonas sp. CNPT3]